MGMFRHTWSIQCCRGCCVTEDGLVGFLEWRILMLCHSSPAITRNVRPQHHSPGLHNEQGHEVLPRAELLLIGVAPVQATACHLCQSTTLLLSCFATIASRVLIGLAPVHSSANHVQLMLPSKRHLIFMQADVRHAWMSEMEQLVSAEVLSDGLTATFNMICSVVTRTPPPFLVILQMYLRHR